MAEPLLCLIGGYLALCDLQYKADLVRPPRPPQQVPDRHEAANERQLHTPASQRRGGGVPSAQAGTAAVQGQMPQPRHLQAGWHASQPAAVADLITQAAILAVFGVGLLPDRVAGGPRR